MSAISWRRDLPSTPRTTARQQRPPSWKTSFDSSIVLLETGLSVVKPTDSQDPWKGSRNAMARFYAGEPINTPLATFLALSFCDLSTPEDHDMLVSQFRRQGAAVQSQVNTMLSERGLSVAVGPNDYVEGAVHAYEQIFRQYVADPLWPPFKFPLTSNEEARLTGKVRLRLMRLVPILDEISLKVKYGGISPQLKKMMLYEISRVAENLVAETAFLRKPTYPGVSCHYRGSCGFCSRDRGDALREWRPSEGEIQGDEILSPWTSPRGKSSSRKRG